MNNQYAVVLSHKPTLGIQNCVATPETWQFWRLEYDHHGALIQRHWVGYEKSLFTEEDLQAITDEEGIVFLSSEEFLSWLNKFNL